ncbi:hypothetical protein PR048_024687 [Dryococelus australis]|uniref:Uncharacterized protein n=1 Tax=Dryococelus australis TaxID=614101 RepID=A0ABQ9GPA7_9NEOP|nr:hypothetical protein PR048_024687 [Dryococelus australis]
MQRQGKRQIPEKNPPADGIGRHNSHMRESGSDHCWESNQVRLDGRRIVPSVRKRFRLYNFIFPVDRSSSLTLACFSVVQQGMRFRSSLSLLGLNMWEYEHFSSIGCSWIILYVEGRDKLQKTAIMEDSHLTLKASSLLIVSPSSLTATQTYLPALWRVTFCNTRLWLLRIIRADMLWLSDTPCRTYPNAHVRTNYYDRLFLLLQVTSSVDFATAGYIHHRLSYCMLHRPWVGILWVMSDVGFATLDYVWLARVRAIAGYVGHGLGYRSLWWLWLGLLQIVGEFYNTFWHEVLWQLKKKEWPRNLDGMIRFFINILGLSFERMNTLYKGILLGIISYGVSVWYPNARLNDVYQGSASYCRVIPQDILEEERCSMLEEVDGRSASLARKKEKREASLEIWHERLYMSEKGRVTYSIFPDIKEMYRHNGIKTDYHMSHDNKTEKLQSQGKEPGIMETIAIETEYDLDKIHDYRERKIEKIVGQLWVMSAMSWLLWVTSAVDWAAVGYVGCGLGCCGLRRLWVGLLWATSAVGWASVGYVGSGLGFCGLCRQWVGLLWAMSAVGWASVGYVAVGWASVGYVAVGWASVGYVAVGWASVGYVAVDWAFAGYITVGWASVGYATVGWASVGYATVGWASVGYATVGWSSVGYVTVGWASVGYVTVGWAFPWVGRLSHFSHGLGGCKLGCRGLGFCGLCRSGLRFCGLCHSGLGYRELCRAWVGLGYCRFCRQLRQSWIGILWVTSSMCSASPGYIDIFVHTSPESPAQNNSADSAGLNTRGKTPAPAGQHRRRVHSKAFYDRARELVGDNSSARAALATSTQANPFFPAPLGSLTGCPVFLFPHCEPRSGRKKGVTGEGWADIAISACHGNTLLSPLIHSSQELLVVLFQHPTCQDHITSFCRTATTLANILHQQVPLALQRLRFPKLSHMYSTSSGIHKTQATVEKVNQSDGTTETRNRENQQVTRLQKSERNHRTCQRQNASDVRGSIHVSQGTTGNRALGKTNWRSSAIYRGVLYGDTAL